MLGLATATGQLGNGTTTDALTAVDVIGLTAGVTAISAGGYHTCALTSGGAAKCWGRNMESAQLGNGTTTDALTALDVTGLTAGVTAISAGGDHTCALVVGGAAKCWGWNNFGQLGNGMTVYYAPTPVVVIVECSGFMDLGSDSAFCPNVEWLRNRAVTLGCTASGVLSRQTAFHAWPCPPS